MLKGDAGTSRTPGCASATTRRRGDCNEFKVKPNHVFLSVHPSDGQYGSGKTQAGRDHWQSAQVRDKGNNVLMTGSDYTNEELQSGVDACLT